VIICGECAAQVCDMVWITTKGRSKVTGVEKKIG